MKKSLLSLVSVILILTLMLSSLALFSASAVEGTEKNTDSLPSSVDLSATKYFPPIGSQGGLSSCATYSSIYYQFTYEMNKMRDTQATEETTMSPKLIYHLCNAAFGGTLQEQNYDLLIQQGAPSIATLPYSDIGHLDWFAEEKYWNEAMDCRLESYYTLKDVGLEDSQITSVDDEDLYEIKSTLALGKVLTYSTYINSWVTDKIVSHPDAPENAKYEGEEIVKYRNGNEGGHGMTLVGYNDNIWLDQNSNSQVDEGEMGAFKIANSWGDGYANDGFCWISYDALNKVTSVEGGYSGYREPAFKKCMAVNVRPYKDGSDIYLRFTMNTADRVQMNVTFYAEKNGTVQSAQFLSGANYRSDKNRYSFAGTTDATDGTFCYPLDNVVKELSAENFEDYTWSVSFNDSEYDSVPLVVKNVELVNENTGKIYKAEDTEFALDGEEKTILVKNTTSQDKVVYYLGYDEPVIYYKSGDNEFISAKMQYTEERKGFNYKYVIENTPDEITLYFADHNGNIDNNGGEYYKAVDRISGFVTEDVREAFEIEAMGYSNGLPDVGKTSFFAPLVKGGYAPYKFSYTVENLQTGEVKEFPFDLRYDAYYTFPEEGKYRFFIEARDQANNTATLDETVEITDAHFVFSEFCANPAYGNSFLAGNGIIFYAKTDFEDIISRGPFHSKYEFIIKDSEGNTVYTEITKSSRFDLNNCTSEISLVWTPYKSGTYTISVSSTDDNNEYAEKQIQFIVLDKIYGDADGNGKLNVKDATLIQKYVAGFVLTEYFYEELADCVSDEGINIKDATAIQKLIADIDSISKAGQIIECEPPRVEPTEPPTEAPAQDNTVPPTEPDTEEPTEPERDVVYFTDSQGWGGSIYCYYWSDSNKNMTSWPGQMMAKAGVNEYGQTIYTMGIYTGVEYVIFSGGGKQTVDIPYGGGEVRYYSLSETDSNGHYKVANW